MKKRANLLSFSMTIIFFLFIFVNLHADEDINGKFNRLKEGMTTDQVKELLGKADSITEDSETAAFVPRFGKKVIVWHYGSKYSVYFANQKAIGVKRPMSFSGMKTDFIDLISVMEQILRVQGQAFK
jgi:hypothetical protein